MNVLKLGSSEPDVILLQSFLELKLDGSFGPKTESAVREYQTLSGLKSDGVVGQKTWDLLRESFGEGPLKESDYKEAAGILGVVPAVIKAVREVESGPGGAFSSTTGRPVCLFEGHIFWKELKARGIDPERYTGTNPGIVYKSWDRTKYTGGSKEWNRLDEAWKINAEAALCSASLGLFQIMGFNWKSSGASGVQDFYGQMFAGEASQLKLFCNFIKSQGLDKNLKNLDWSGFARKYNGPEYSKNQYDLKLEKAYKKYL